MLKNVTELDHAASSHAQHNTVYGPQGATTMALSQDCYRFYFKPIIV